MPFQNMVMPIINQNANISVYPINPVYNQNPIVVNPSMNLQVNPNINQQVNPNINQQINPNINQQINSNINQQ